nr:hypothetical protein CFP56_74092 [Quercus suber]
MQQFSIGVNDVTRVLECMAPSAQVGSSPQLPSSIRNNCKAPLVQLQLTKEFDGALSYPRSFSCSQLQFQVIRFYESVDGGFGSVDSRLL